MVRCLAVCAVLFFCAPVLAHDHNNPSLDSWYQSLQRPDRGSYGYQGIVSCCNKQDCHPTDAEHRDGDWWARPVIIHEIGKEGEMGEWMRVPPEKVLKNTTNPTGRAVLCHTQSWIGNTFSAGSISIYCFVAPPEV